jgi:hypothetical protein
MSSDVLDFSRKAISLKFDGKSCVIKKPSWKRVSEYSKRVKKVEPEEAMEKEAVPFLVSLGCDEDILNELDFDQIQQLMERVIAAPKK